MSLLTGYFLHGSKGLSKLSSGWTSVPRSSGDRIVRDWPSHHGLPAGEHRQPTALGVVDEMTKSVIPCLAGPSLRLAST
jgi:hypothetical protein